MTALSTTSGCTIPLPTVVATATPKPKAATKLKNAAHATAFPGDKLLYTFHIQNFTFPVLNNISVSDVFDALNASPSFVPGSLALVSSNLPAGGTPLLASAILVGVTLLTLASIHANGVVATLVTAFKKRGG